MKKKDAPARCAGASYMVEWGVLQKSPRSNTFKKCTFGMKIEFQFFKNEIKQNIYFFRKDKNKRREDVVCELHGWLRSSPKNLKLLWILQPPDHKYGTRRRNIYEYISLLYLWGLCDWKTKIEQ
jgi:hypothetical protein